MPECVEPRSRRLCQSLVSLAIPATRLYRSCVSTPSLKTQDSAGLCGHGRTSVIWILSARDAEAKRGIGVGGLQFSTHSGQIARCSDWRQAAAVPASETRLNDGPSTRVRERASLDTVSDSLGASATFFIEWSLTGFIRIASVRTAGLAVPSCNTAIGLAVHWAALLTIHTARVVRGQSCV